MVELGTFSLVDSFPRFIATLDELRRGAMPWNREAVQAELFQFESEVRNAREEVEELLKTVPLTLDFKPIFSRFSEGASCIRQGAESKSPVLLEKGIALLQSAFDSYYSGLLDLYAEKIGQGPTQDPHLNLLLRLHAMVVKETTYEKLFHEVVASYGVLFGSVSRNYRRILRMLRSLPQTAIPIQERALTYQEAQQAFQTLQELALQKKYAEMSASLKKLGEFADGYYELGEASLKELENNKLKAEKVCFRCGKENPEKAWACVGCGFVFSKLDFARSVNSSPSLEVGESGISSSQFQGSPNLERLFNAVEDFLDHEMTREELLPVLDWMQEMINKDAEICASLEQKMDDLEKQEKKAAERNKSIFEESLKKTKAILEKYREGFNLSCEGISALRTWSASLDQAELERGMNLSFQGAEKMFEALRPEETLAPEDLSRFEDTETGSSTLGFG